MRYKVPPARLSLMSEDSLWCKIDKNSIILSGVHTLVPIVFPLSGLFSLAGISTPHRGAANVLLERREIHLEGKLCCEVRLCQRKVPPITRDLSVSFQ